MKKLFLPLAAVASIGVASAATFPTNTTPAWKSYMATGNTADIVSSPTVAAAIGAKVDATSGQSLNQTIDTPTIAGGSATGTDISAAIELAVAQSGASPTSTVTTAVQAGTYVTPFDFLSSGQTPAQLTSGEIDAEPVFARAIAGGNRVLNLPCGTYVFNEGLTITSSFTRITGGQYGCAVIKQNFTTGNAISIDGSGSSSGVEGITVDHIKVEMASGVTKTTGASFRALSGHNIKFLYDRTDGDYIGFDFRSGANQFDYFAVGNEINNATYTAFLLTDNGTVSQQVEDVYLSDNAIGHSGIGYLIQNASGVFGLHSDMCCSSGAGVVVAPGVNQNVNALYLTKFLGDQTTQVDGAFSFPNSGGFVSEVRLTDCWGASNTAGPGLSVANPRLNGMVIEGFQAHANYLAGIDIEAGTNIVIHGAVAQFNSFEGSADMPGILIQGTASHITLSDSISGSGGFELVSNSGKTNLQNYGFLISGSASYIIAHDNQTFGNVTAGYNDASSSSTTNSVHDNLSQ